MWPRFTLSVPSEAIREDVATYIEIGVYPGQLRRAVFYPTSGKGDGAQTQI